MEDWKEVTLESICNELSDGLHKAPKFVQNGEYIFVNAKNLSNGKIIDVDKSKHTSYEEYLKYKIELDNNTLLYSIDGTIGNLARYNNEKCVLGKGACYLKIKDNVSVEYVYYQLQSPHFKNYIQFFTTGSTIGHISLKTMRNYAFNLPPLATQKKIAEVLSSLDDKIELNNKINANLEQQAHAIFKSWFVDNGEKNGTIGDYCNVKSGFAFKSSWWQEDGVKVVRIGDIEQGNLSLDTCAHVSEDKIEKAKEFILKGGDLVIAMTGATIGKFSMIPNTEEIILANQRVGKFFLGENAIEKVPFIYCTLKNEEVISEFINRGQGSAQPNISTSDILTIPCWIPDSKKINEFNNATKAIFETIISNQQENKKLSNIRDTLLPKLMNGEIDI